MRSIRPQTVTLAVLAIMFGLGAMYFARQILLARRELPVVQPAPAPQEPMAPLLVLQTNLPGDSRIRDQDVGQVSESLARLKEKEVPLDKALKFKQQAVGRILKTAKTAGSWLTTEDFYEVGKGPELKLKPGFRAVTVRVDDPAISSSVIQAGCLVDVIYTGENPDDGTKLSHCICSALEVLNSPVSEGGQPNSVMAVGGKSYVVLAANAEDATRLAEANKADGAISLTLRAVKSPEHRPDSTGIDIVPGERDYKVTERDLLNLPPPRSPPPAPERIVVEQIKGNKIDYVVFTGDEVRLTEEEALRSAVPAAAHSPTAAAAAPKTKKCKTCGKTKGHSGGAAPSGTPNPTPAPKESQPQETPLPEPITPAPPSTWQENGDSPHLCVAPSGPFRQMGTVPVFLLMQSRVLITDVAPNH